MFNKYECGLLTTSDPVIVAVVSRKIVCGIRSWRWHKMSLGLK